MHIHMCIKWLFPLKYLRSLKYMYIYIPKDEASNSALIGPPTTNTRKTGHWYMCVNCILQWKVFTSVTILEQPLYLTDSLEKIFLQYIFISLKH